MLILTIRTDKPESELGLYEDNKELDYETWQAHRQLAETLHRKIETLLAKHDKSFDDLRGIVAFKGPGSFTGLRIGLSVANALAHERCLAIATNGEEWQKQGIEKLLSGEADSVLLPEYGSPATVTAPRK